MAKKWGELRLRSQLLIAFSLCVVLALILAEIMSLGFLLAVTYNIKNTSKDILTTQLKDNLAESVVGTAGTLFELQVASIVDAGLSVVRVAAGDASRADYSSGPEASFFDDPTTIDNPQLQPADATRFAGKTISLTHSSWTIPNYTGTTDPTPQLTQQQAQDLASSSHLDTFYRVIYENNPSIVGIYSGYASGLYRQYPGTGTIRGFGPYDPTARPWYKNAVKGTASTLGSSAAPYVITNPYLDAQGKGWLMTTSSVIPATTSPGSPDLGVAAVAVTLSRLASTLSAFQLSNTSQVSIYTNDANGFALANPTWDLSVAVGVTTQSNTLFPFTYKNSTGPVITDSAWQSILANSDASISTAGSNYASMDHTDPQTGVQYILIWKTLTVSNGLSPGSSKPSFLVLGAIPAGIATAPVNDITSSMDRTLTTTSAISVAVFVVIVGTVLLCSSNVARLAVRNLELIQQKTTVMARNVGHRNLADGVAVPDATDAPPIYTSTEAYSMNSFGVVDETDHLERRFYSLVRSIRDPATAEDAGNPFHLNAGQARNNGLDLMRLDAGVLRLLEGDLPPEYSNEEPRPNSQTYPEKSGQLF